MTPIDYLLVAGFVLASGYVVARLFTGWVRSSGNHTGVERGNEVDAPIIPERVEKTGAPWHFRK
jgi:hypothetical protein